MDKAGDACKSAKESCQDVPQINLKTYQKMLLFKIHQKLGFFFFFFNFMNELNDIYVQAGQQMKAKAEGAVEAAKDATGMNK